MNCDDDDYKTGGLTLIIKGNLVCGIWFPEKAQRKMIAWKWFTQLANANLIAQYAFGYDWKGLGFRLIILNSGENIDRFWREVLTNPEGISILLFDIVLRDGPQHNNASRIYCTVSWLRVFAWSFVEVKRFGHNWKFEWIPIHKHFILLSHVFHNAPIRPCFMTWYLVFEDFTRFGLVTLKSYNPMNTSVRARYISTTSAIQCCPRSPLKSR